MKRDTATSYDKTYIDNQFNNYYTLVQTNALLNTKLHYSANSNYYTKAQTDLYSILRYTKTETDGLLHNTANAVDIFTNIESNNWLANKLDATTHNTGIALKSDTSNVYYKNVLYTRYLISGIDFTNYYNKPEMNIWLGLKLSTSVFKTEIGLKCNISDVYYNNVLFTHSEMNALLASKLDSSVISNYYKQS